MVELNLGVVQPVKLSLQSRFKFRCHPGLSCFTECCGKTTIILTPYDILRLKARLGINSGEFLSQYTRKEEHDKSGLPLVLMNMARFAGRCPFVRPVSGCQVYRDRPATCRYYPIGQGSLITESGLDEFYFYIREDHCQGWAEDTEWTVESWRADQGFDLYDDMNREWKAMMLRRDPQGQPELEDRAKNLFYMVMYDLDQFRRFVFKSRFLQLFQVETDILEKIWDDDEELLKFGYQYVKMALKFGEPLKLKDQAVTERTTLTF